MARKKSLKDIREQSSRIRQMISDRAMRNGNIDADGFMTNQRDIAAYRRVNAIAEKYTNNIRKTKEYARDDRNVRLYVRNAITERDERKYSQKTYKGLVGG